jgi:hypothetical protein
MATLKELKKRLRSLDRRIERGKRYLYRNRFWREAPYCRRKYDRVSVQVQELDLIRKQFRYELKQKAYEQRVAV